MPLDSRSGVMNALAVQPVPDTVLEKVLQSMVDTSSI